MSGTVSKWLTLRELIREEERLLFARHSQSQSAPTRKAAEEMPPRSEAQDQPSSPHARGFLGRKELY